MPSGWPATFLDLAVGPYRLALRADCVVGVLGNLSAGEPVQFRGICLPLTDLSALLAGATRSRVPFGVALETEAAGAVAGVDSVGHLRLDEAATVRPLPSFGLTHPELFDGVLRDELGLLLVLRPASVVRLTAAKERDI